MADPIATDAAGIAELLGCSERLVRSLTQEGRIPSIALPGHRNRLYSVDAVRRWAVDASGYTRPEEADDDTDERSTRANPAKGRPVVHRRPDRPRKPRASRAPLPLRVVEG